MFLEPAMRRLLGHVCMIHQSSAFVPRSPQCPQFPVKMHESEALFYPSRKSHRNKWGLLSSFRTSLQGDCVLVTLRSLQVKKKKKVDGWGMVRQTSSHFKYQNNSKCPHFNYFCQTTYFRFIEFRKGWLNVMKNWNCIFSSAMMKWHCTSQYSAVSWFFKIYWHDIVVRPNVNHIY